MVSRTTILLLVCTIFSLSSAQNNTGSQVDFIQFSDEDCLCANNQVIATTDVCLPADSGYEIYSTDGEHVTVQTCADNACTKCSNSTQYDLLPPCKARGSNPTNYFTVQVSNETYYNAPSVWFGLYNTANCTGNPVKVDIAFGLSCVVTAEGSYYYECPGFGSTYYVYNCSDSACQVGCNPTTLNTEQCTPTEGVFSKSVVCSNSGSTSSTSSFTSGNSAGNGASATVSTTTSASSHNVSTASSASASAASSTSGGSINTVFTNDVRGGYIRSPNSQNNNNIFKPPFCNGGSTTSSTAGNSVATAGTNGATSATAGNSASNSASNSAAASNSASNSAANSASNSASATGGFKRSFDEKRSKMNIH